MNQLISGVWNWFLRLLLKHTVLILILLFCAGVGIALSNMSNLSSSLIESQARMNAELQTKSIIESWKLYSNDVDRIKKVPGITVTHDYLLQEAAIPTPATYAIELGRKISSKQSGMSVRMYSDYPFPWRKAEGGAKTKFEKDALNYLRKYPESKEFYRIEKSPNGKLWRYGQAVVMEPSCVACHNTRPYSPKKDWQVGDVRGVLTVTQSLNSFTEKTNRAMQGASVMLGGFSVLGISALTLVIGRLRQTTTQLEARVRERTTDLFQANTDLEKRNGLIRQVFGRYLSDEIVANLLENPHGLKLGGERRKITILTSDLRGFTAISERLSAEEVITILNIYLKEMADIITNYQGTINEFMGDGILVLFGAPTPREDDATRAVACACAMQLAMDVVNAKLKQLGFPQLNMGIGINTGIVVLGNIGSEKRSKYGIVGNQVNLTYRIESYTTGGQILISKQTLDDGGSIIKVRGQKQVQPKGIKQLITIYEVGGIGGKYNQFLPEDTELFFAITEAIPIEYTVLEEKHISKTIFKGKLTELSEKGAKICCEHMVKGDLPPAMTNIKLNLLTLHDPECKSEDIYAKVLEKPAEHGSFYIYFTAKTPAVQARFNTLYKSLQHQ